MVRPNLELSACALSISDCRSSADWDTSTSKPCLRLSENFVRLFPNSLKNNGVKQLLSMTHEAYPSVVVADSFVLLFKDRNNDCFGPVCWYPLHSPNFLTQLEQNIDSSLHLISRDIVTTRRFPAFVFLIASSTSSRSRSEVLFDSSSFAPVGNSNRIVASAVMLTLVEMLLPSVLYVPLGL